MRHKIVDAFAEHDLFLGGSSEWFVQRSEGKYVWVGCHLNMLTYLIVHFFKA